ncbi:MAG: Ig-like domain-containing protein [Chitinophagaceae bacterium]
MQNGCVTITPNPGTTIGGTTCVVACKNGICDTTYITIDAPVSEFETEPDINVTIINTPVTGDLNFNDNVPIGSTYGTPIANPSNPSTALPTVNTDGSYTFTPTVAGEYTFLVPVCPPSQTTNCPEELLTITVLDPAIVTNSPTANTDVATIIEGNPVTVNVLSNDQCNNGPTCTLSNPTIVSQPNNGTVVVNTDGTITYTPNTGFVGTDSLLYATCDNQVPFAKCDTEYVFITANPIGTPNSVEAVDDYKLTGMNVTATGNVLANDIDPESNTMTVTAQTISDSNGTFTLNANGTYTFVPATGNVGPASYTYVVCDNGTPSACDSATVYFMVKSPDVTPNITITPNVLHGTSTFNTTVRVTELNMVNTNGTITVRIPKDNRVSFTYNPALTNIGFTTLNNSQWTYDGSNLFFHVFTTTATINAGSFSTFGFTATFNPLNSDGKYTMTSTISSGSGSETRTNNNTDSEAADFFHN